MPDEWLKAPRRAVAIPEPTDSGLYIRLGAPQRVARTVIRREWPLLAVDLDRSGRAIGIEAIPRPKLSIAKIVQQAGVLLT